MDNNPTAPASGTSDAATYQPNMSPMPAASGNSLAQNPAATAGIPVQPIPPLETTTANTQPNPVNNPYMPSQSAPDSVAKPSPSMPAHSNRSSWLLYVVIAIALLILVGGGAWVLLTKNTNPQANQSAHVIPTAVLVTPTIIPSPTPVISPITPQNADQSLSNTENNIDQSLQQATQDMNSMNQINSSQDNPNSVN